MRKSGMKNIQKRGDTFRVQIRRVGLPALGGTFDTLKEAQEYRDRITITLKRANANDILKADAITLKYAIGQYIEDKRPAASELSTFNVIVKILDHLRLLHLPLSEFDLRKAKECIKVREKWYKRGISEDWRASPKTVVHFIGHLSKVLDYTIYEENLTIENPMKNIIKPEVKNERDERITNAEIQQIIDALPRVPAYAKNLPKNRRQYYKTEDLKIIPFIIKLALNTGLRRGEITQLKLNDFQLDTENPFLNVRRTISKTKKPRRITLLKAFLPVCRKFIEDKRKICAPNALAVDINKNIITSIYHHAHILAGFEGLRFHDLRHEATSRLVEAGVPIALAMTFTGHKTLQMIDRYTHLEHGSQAYAIEKAGL